MVIGAIFAGGIGSRMGSADMPKQYLQLGSKPIIVHTIEKFVVNPGIDRIIVLCPKAWIAHTKDLVKKYLGEAIAEKINVVEGGSTRNGTLENALKFINENFAIDDDSENVSSIPTRSELYQGQTPQSFRIKELESVLNSLTEDEKNTLTDASKIYTIKNKPVRIVDGEVFNIKITYTYDLKVANALLGVVNNDK